MRLKQRDREYMVPLDEAQALVHELNGLSQDDELGHPFAVACLSVATIVSVALEGEPMPAQLELTDSEAAALGTAIALLIERGKGGAALQDLQGLFIPPRS
jgi:hypothetical protein